LKCFFFTHQKAFPSRQQKPTMEFDEINALINIERENYKNDLKYGRISLISHSIKQTKQQIKAQRAERAAMDRIKQLTQQAQFVLIQLNWAMADHAKHLKNVASTSTF
jgi:hypothetical protein